MDASRAVYRVQLTNLSLPLVDREIASSLDTREMLAWVKVRLGYEASALLSELGVRVELGFKVERLADQLSLLS